MRPALALAACLLASFPLYAADNDAAPRASTGATRPAEPAQTAPRSALFDRLDRNRDGRLSREEMESDEARKANWIASDRDNDGRISRSEFSEISTVAGGTRR
jgi:Ca2+-binding EF-hand superfamily protein